MRSLFRSYSRKLTLSSSLHSLKKSLKQHRVRREFVFSSALMLLRVSAFRATAPNGFRLISALWFSLTAADLLLLTLTTFTEELLTETTVLKSSLSLTLLKSSSETRRECCRNLLTLSLTTAEEADLLQALTTVRSSHFPICLKVSRVDSVRTSSVSVLTTQAVLLSLLALSLRCTSAVFLRKWLSSFSNRL